MTMSGTPQPEQEATGPGDIDFTSSVFYLPREARVAAGAGPATDATATGPGPLDVVPEPPRAEVAATPFATPPNPPAPYAAPPNPQAPYAAPSYPQAPYPQGPNPQATYAAPSYPKTTYAAPAYPLRPPPRRRRSHSGVSIALVLALLAGVLGGGYWLAHRHVDTGDVSNPGTRPVVLPALPGRSLDTVTAAPAPAVPSTRAGSGGYLYRAKAFTVRLPHRPTTGKLPVPSGVGLDKALMIGDARDQTGVEWARFAVTIPVTEQSTVLEGAVHGLGESGRLTTSNERMTTFHGHPARLVTARSQDGTELTALAAVFRPTHLLIIIAPSGRPFDLVAGSFALRG